MALEMPDEKLEGVDRDANAIGPLVAWAQA